jgi:hypothetical protein
MICHCLSHKVQIFTYDALLRALQVRDLTDPLAGGHALQPLVAAIHGALATRWQCPRLVHRACPLVSRVRLGLT